MILKNMTGLWLRNDSCYNNSQRGQENIATEMLQLSGLACCCKRCSPSALL